MNKSILINVTAVVISICALTLSLKQAQEAEKVSSVSVFPHIDITMVGGKGSGQENGIRLDNAGTGPALIDDFNLYVDGKIIKGKKHELWWDALIKLGFTPQEIYDFRTFYFTNTAALKDGNVYYLIRPKLINNDEFRSLTEYEWDKLQKLTIRIDYHGAFGDKCYVTYTPANKGSAIERTECIKT